MTQTPPFSVQVELVEGCTLACEFCGINGIREKPGNFKHMKAATAVRIAMELKRLKADGWNPRIEFAMHGEPSMHEYLDVVVNAFREALGPKTSLVMFSNGSGFLSNPTKKINSLLEAGLNTLGLDNYEHVSIVPRVIGSYQGPYPVYHYPEQEEHNLHSGRRVGHKDIVVIRDITTAAFGNHSTLNTHCGGGTEVPESMPLKQRCAKPFREMSFRWDGNVAICCNDFRGVYKCGNILELPMDALWNNQAFHSARKKLYHSDRGFDPCDKCNAKSMRVGLLPDHRGNEVLQYADATDAAVIAEATAGASYTSIILRRWEKKTHPDQTYNLVPDRTKALKDAMKNGHKS